MGETREMFVPNIIKPRPATNFKHVKLCSKTKTKFKQNWCLTGPRRAANYASHNQYW